MVEESGQREEEVGRPLVTACGYVRVKHRALISLAFNTPARVTFALRTQGQPKNKGLSASLDPL